MVMYALVDPADEIVRQVSEERLDLNAGTRAGYRWLPVQESTSDTSTLAQSYVKKSVSVTVQADHVARVTTIEDMTPAEIDAVNDARAERELKESVGKLLLAVFRKLAHNERVLFKMAKDAGLVSNLAQYGSMVDAAVADTALSGANFRSAVNNAVADDIMIPVGAFKQWVIAQLREDN